MSRSVDSDPKAGWTRFRPALALLGAIGLVSVVVVAACSGEAIEVPEFAIGVDGPAVLDETGLIIGWELVDVDGFEAGFADRPGRYTGESGIDTTTAESTEIIVSWSALPCQESPVARFMLADNGLRIDITPGRAQATVPR